MTITFTRSASAPAGRARRTATIPATATSIDARVYVGSGTSGPPISTACTSFAPGATSATITVLVPVALDTLVLSSYDGGCSASGQNGTATGNLLTRFVGTGTVTVSSTDAASVFNNGAPILLSKILPVFADSVPAITWTSIGPRNVSGDNGKLQSFIRNPAHPSTMWVAGGFGAGYEVGTQAGVMKSNDGGTTWVAKNNGLTDAVVNALWLSPDTSTLLAATQYDGVFRSVDGAASWARTLSTSSTCVVSGADGAVYACGGEGVYRSADSGLTWSLAFATAQPVNAIALGGAVLYAGTIGNHVASNAGGTWADRGVVGTYAGVHALVYDAVHGKLFASSNASITNSSCPIGCATQVLSYSPDGGASWGNIALPANARGAQTLAASAIAPGTIYVGDANVIYRTSDGGASFTTVGYSSGDSRGDFVSASADGHNDVIDAATDQGIHESANSGSSYTTLANGLTNYVIYGVAVNGSTVLTAVQDFAPFVTGDDGASWTLRPYSDNFFEDGEPWIDPSDAAHAYLWDGYGFHRSADGGHTWTVGSGIPNASYTAPDAIATDPTHPGTVYVAVSSGVLKSADYGATFSSAGWSVTSPSSVYVSRDAKTIVVTQLSSNWAIWSSRDGGATFQKSNYTNGVGGRPLVAISSTDSDVVVVATFGFSSSPAVFRSTDGAQTFVPLSTSGIATRSRPNLRHPMGRRVRDAGEGGVYPWSDAFSSDAFAFTSPQRLRFDGSGTPPLLALSTTTGIFVSSDYGLHWHDESANAIGHAFYGIGWSGGKMYVATAGQGILRSTPLR